MKTKKIATISIDGIRIEYEQRDGRGVPIIFLHGFGVGRRMWCHQMRAFAGRNRVIALDFPGHGGSDSPADLNAYSEQKFVEIVIALMDHLKITRAVIVGLSMGGGIALKFAIDHPERTAGLLFADTGSGSDDAATFREQTMARVAVLRQKGLDAFVQMMLTEPTTIRYVSGSPWKRRHVQLMEQRNNAIGLAMVLEGVQAARPATQDRALERISAPTVALVGEFDTACIKSTRYAAAKIPGARYVEPPGLGHLTALENPAAFNRALAELLDRAAV